MTSGVVPILVDVVQAVVAIPELVRSRGAHGGPGMKR